MITLDWDNITYPEAERRIRYIMGDPFVRSIEVRASPSLGGFHIYVESDNEGGITHTWGHRRSWRDDGRRLVNDILAPREIYRNVMFVYKSSPLGNMGEMKMFKYTRTKEGWKCQSLIKPALPTSSQDLLLSQESCLA